MKKVINKFSSQVITNIRPLSTQKNVQEVRIRVPAGTLAGKWWGPTDKRPIIAFHGWLDNCGSFDKLIPLLPDHIPVLALDFPGHGYSYKQPAGYPYHNSHGMLLIKELMKCFGWKKITLMGHSLGAMISYTYGSFFPKDLDFSIFIDALQPYIFQEKTERVIQSIDEFLKYDALEQKLEEPPNYTLTEMIERLHIATGMSIAEETAKYILYRNIAPSKIHPGRYYFSRDARLKVGPIVNVDPLEIIKCAANITFPVFISKAEGGPFFENTMFDDVYNILKTSSSDCQLHEIAGSHYVHLNEPSVVAGLISEFIMKHDKETRNYGGLKSEMICNENTLDVDIFSELETS